MNPARRQGPGGEPIATGLYAVRYGQAQPMAAGDRMRGTPCLVCGFAIGGRRAVTVVITHYMPGRAPAGSLPCSSWLIHDHHPRPDIRLIHDLAEWRLGTHPAQREEST